MFIKILKKIRTISCIIIFKMLYGSRIEFGRSLGISRGINIVIGREGNLLIGNGVFFNNYCSINCLSSIEIGDNCIFGEGVKIYDHNHIYSSKGKIIKEQGFKSGNIRIGNNCWIGSNVTILNNVAIGDNVVIGANCLIYKSIEVNSIVKSSQQLTIKQLSQS